MMIKINFMKKAIKYCSWVIDFSLGVWIVSGATDLAIDYFEEKLWG